MKLAPLALCALLFAGCVTPPRPTDAEIAAAFVGDQPTEQEVKVLVGQYLHDTLKDPASAVIEYGSIGKGCFLRSGAKAWRFAWDQVAEVNAKNSYGGYVGAKPYHFYFQHGGQLVAVAVPQTLGSGYVYHSVVVLPTPMLPAPGSIESVGPPAPRN